MIAFSQKQPPEVLYKKCFSLKYRKIHRENLRQRLLFNKFVSTEIYKFGISNCTFKAFEVPDEAGLRIQICFAHITSSLKNHFQTEQSICFQVVVQNVLVQLFSNLLQVNGLNLPSDSIEVELLIVARQFLLVARYLFAIICYESIL